MAPSQSASDVQAVRAFNTGHKAVAHGLERLRHLEEHLHDATLVGQDWGGLIGLRLVAADGDATVSELAEPFTISLPAISRHLKVLEQAGLITRSRNAQWRSSTLQADTLREVIDWVEPYRELWDARLDRLDAHLKRMKKEQEAGG